MRRRQALRSEGNAGRGLQMKKPNAPSGASHAHSARQNDKRRRRAEPGENHEARPNRLHFAPRFARLGRLIQRSGQPCGGEGAGREINAAIDGAAARPKPIDWARSRGFAAGGERRSCSWPRNSPSARSSLMRRASAFCATRVRPRPAARARHAGFRRPALLAIPTGRRGRMAGPGRDAQPLPRPDLLRAALGAVSRARARRRVDQA